mmetsp:Transcript_109622/g.291145  ORF Transcript_109622/g.291145 Transcript_109622/m.291145 type:complete len:440 (-) Transcript_109622:99-1418(-)
MGRKKGAGSSKGGKVSKKAKRSAGSGPLGSSDQPNRKDRRKLQRREVRHAQAGVKRAHNGEDAREEQRARMRAKAAERKLARIDGTASVAERCEKLQELAHLQMNSQRVKAAVDSFKQVLDLQPEDPSFVRGPLLCALVDQTRTQEVSDLLKGPLFVRLLAAAGVSVDPPGKKKKKGADAEAAAPAGDAEPAAPAGDGADAAPVLLDKSGSPSSRAATTACYTIALLTYISVAVLEEHGKDPNKAAAGEKKLLTRLRAAKKRNPFVAEYLAFAPAFEPHFPQGAELPPSDECREAELPLLEALEYCCRYRQAAIWMDTDEEVRRFLRSTLFEEEEEAEPEGEAGKPEAAKVEGGEPPPPFAVLPEVARNESELLRKWRKAREDALELWATEMSVEGGSADGEADEAGEGEEEEESDGEGSESMGSSEAMAALESRLNMG